MGFSGARRKGVFAEPPAASRPLPPGVPSPTCPAAVGLLEVTPVRKWEVGAFLSVPHFPLILAHAYSEGPHTPGTILTHSLWRKLREGTQGLTAAEATGPQ